MKYLINIIDRLVEDSMSKRSKSQKTPKPQSPTQSDTLEKIVDLLASVKAKSVVLVLALDGKDPYLWSDGSPYDCAKLTSHANHYFVEAVRDELNLKR